MQSRKKEQGQNAESVAGRARKPRRRTSPPAYPLDQRRKAVQLHVEEGLPLCLVAEEMGMCHDTVAAWVRRYREQGEAGLAPHVGGPRPGSRSGLPPAVHAAIVAAKRET